MRFAAILGSVLAMLPGLGQPVVPLPKVEPIINLRRPHAPRGGKPPFSYRTGVKYPHISKRQRARYARQIEAGQLNMEVVS